MKFFRRSDDVSAEMDEMRREGKTENAEAATTTTVKQLFKEPELQKPLAIACMLAVIQQFSGINAVYRPQPTRRTSWKPGLPTRCELVAN